MAWYEGIKTGTFIAGANLDDHLYHTVKLNASGRVVVTDTATDIVLGVIAVDPGPSAAGASVTVALINGSDKLPFIAGTAIARGNLLIVDVNGGRHGRVQSVATLSAITSNGMAVGQALEAATANGQVITATAMSLFKSG